MFYANILVEERFFILTILEKKKALIIPDNQCLNIEPLARLELATYALRMRCSTN